MDTDGGGWTVFQSRFNGSVDFNRTFSEYEHGFGSLYGEFWLGLSIVQEMAAQNKTELRLDLTAANGNTAFEVFQNFRLDNNNYYKLHIDGGTGTAGDGSRGLSFSNGGRFATYDRPDPNQCATRYQASWWFNECFFVNLNGRYITPGTQYLSQGIMYYAFQNGNSLKNSQMKFRKCIIQK